MIRRGPGVGLISIVVPALVSCAAGPESSACRLTPIHAGICHLGADHILGEGRSPEQRLPFVIYSFLVESPGGERALIDLGPMSLETTNAMFRRHGFFRDLGSGLAGRQRFPDDVV